ncbi:hypothetical protein CHLNCDRAFT_134918 [Chlorella variabilis]|uniref:Hemerythrin-like domain-containing protein n=1 Tax=Chlorella variabilis TaxID=554065 RepID=E1ZH41_CHLVA|nr:hypothetical protein CHLNCDRAFT_134918 [Chlorella variabilis]EFN55052.1 hypothetical protein CHLNCDRAFT_134918 [Chlorella variabilis]|eukprot:XP_005847154.1 hypothetical protein CHLNCDRAFT_134918 [Chlorella variabilis]
MAPKSPASNKKPAAGSPKQKSPKKAKTEEEELPAAVAAAEEEEEAEVDVGEEEEEAGDVEGGPAAGEGPATRTRAKDEGAAPASAAKQTAKVAATNALPQPTIVDILLGDHRDTVALLKHFDEVSGSGDKLMLEKLTDAIAITIRLHSQARPRAAAQPPSAASSILPPTTTLAPTCASLERATLQAEFEVLYPVMERRLGAKGKEAREHSVEEHSKIEGDLVRALEMRKEGGKELAGTIKEVMDLFIKHLGEEENELVPKMLAQMSEEEQVELAASFLEAKAKALLTPQPATA